MLTKEELREELMYNLEKMRALSKRRSHVNNAPASRAITKEQDVLRARNEEIRILLNY